MHLPSAGHPWRFERFPVTAHATCRSHVWCIQVLLLSSSNNQAFVWFWVWWTWPSFQFRLPPSAWACSEFKSLVTMHQRRCLVQFLMQLFPFLSETSFPDSLSSESAPELPLMVCLQNPRLFSSCSFKFFLPMPGTHSQSHVTFSDIVRTPFWYQFGLSPFSIARITIPCCLNYKDMGFI